MQGSVNTRGRASAPGWMSTRRWLIPATALVLVACSKDKDIDKPAQLPVFNSTLKVDKVWSANVRDKHAKPLRLGLGLAVEDNRVFAAGHKGEIVALDLNTGRTLWRTKTKTALSGGPGVGGGLVVAGSTFGDIVAVGAKDGAVRWKVRVNGEVLAAPAVSERLVAVRTVDGKLHGLSPKDGHEMWVQEQQVPRLSLRGTARPVLTGDLVLCGFDNGKVAAVSALDGSVQWETTIAPAHGKTELERLDDIDSTLRVSGSDIYAVGFQGRIAMLALDTGQIWWAHDASSFRALGLDESAIYMATADGEVVALRRRTGTELWRSRALLHRRLSAAIETDNAVVTADFQGYVHWLDKATGAIAARASTSKVRVSNPPVAVGNMVLVVNDIGRITAFRVTPVGGARVAPAIEAPASESSAAPATGAGGTAAAEQPAAPEPAAPAAPAAPEPSAAPESAAPAAPPAAEPPAQPESSPTLPPGTPPAPLPSQPTPDPLPPQPQTQPHPPPSL
ncbi:MAG TPA: outer membrane protein assembly factor BamB [Steroidobacteraceae bacterium]|nr:outer membrane protein assembly factor BamB [Steroidobacteraceae bacterium]